MAHPSRPKLDRRAIDRAVVALASRQHGRIAIAQLVALGLPRDAVTLRVAAGWLVREHRGAYRLAGASLGGAGACAGAILAVDRLASVAARSALERHGVLREELGASVQLITARHHRSRQGIVVRQATLGPGETVRLDGLRVTSLVRALADAALREPELVIRRAVREAGFLRLLDHACLVDVPGRGPGIRLLRSLGRDALPVVGDVHEELDRRIAEFLGERGFPPAEVNLRLQLHGPREVVVLDVVWREAGLAVELDSRRVHATPAAFESDRRRDRRVLAQLGLDVVRVTWRQLHDDRDALDADLKVLYARGVRAG